MVEPPMPPGPVEGQGDNDEARREEAAVEPFEPVPDEEDPETR